MVQQYVSNLTLIVFTLAIYMIWMDVALYINLQQLPAISERTISKPNDGTPFSPFEPITIKLLMMSPPMHYIDLPLAMWSEESLTVSNYLSPNAVSIIGLIFGLVAARFFMCEGYKWRMLGFVLFKIRDYMDGLDGAVARALIHEKKMTINPGTWGFAMDGICDGIADVTLILATGIYLLRSVGKSERYQRLVDIEAVEAKDAKENSIWSRLKNLQMQWFMPIVINVVIFGCTFGICSGIWNYFMYNYSILFDTELIAQTEHQQAIQLAVLKSPIMWLVVFMWRWINAVSMIQLFLVAVLYDKAAEFLTASRQHGSLIILMASLITYLHYTYALANISV